MRRACCGSTRTRVRSANRVALVPNAAVLVVAKALSARAPTSTSCSTLAARYLQGVATPEGGALHSRLSLMARRPPATHNDPVLCCCVFGWQKRSAQLFP